MGRKKRRVSANEEAEPETSAPPPADPRIKPPPPPPPLAPSTVKIESDDGKNEKDEKEAVKASNYAMTSHSGEIVEEDIYVSEGSEDEDDNVDVVLSGSKMGLMRRGLHQPLLVQPNLRQWVRPDTTEGDAADETEEEQKQKQEEELAALDPAERAARLLAEKQRKLEEAKENARRMESEENAGRDPCLFSKRTAFDIRFDQIDDKPWERGNGDLTDFFNYGLTVEDWLEYAQQQLTIRQELTDASRQKRPPDPNVVPVAARKPKSQTPKVAVVASNDKKEEGEEADHEEENANATVIGPAMIKKEDGDSDGKSSQGNSKENAFKDVYVGEGGAWGAGSAPDSMLARLIAEQTQNENGGVKKDPRPPVQGHHHSQNHHQQNYSDNNQYREDNPYRDDAAMQHSAPGDRYGISGGYENQSEQSSAYGGGDWRQQRPPPPPPPSYHGHDDGGRFGGHGHDDGGRFGGDGGRFGGRGRGRGGRGRFGGRFNNYGRGRGGTRPPFPPQGQGRWGGRGGRGDYRRPRDEYGGGGGGYGGGCGYYQRS